MGFEFALKVLLVSILGNKLPWPIIGGIVSKTKLTGSEVVNIIT